MAQPPLGGETADQSCPTPQSKPPGDRSHQFRIRLSHSHAQRWLALSPQARAAAADLAFATHTQGIELTALQGVVSELKKIRVEINSLLQLAQFSGFSLDTHKAHAALDRINALLGDKP
jgi:hypothetical protein